MVHKRTNRRKTLKGGRRTRRKSRKRLAKKTRRGLRSKKRKRRRKSRKSRSRRGGWCTNNPPTSKECFIKAINNLNLPDEALHVGAYMDKWYAKVMGTFFKLKTVDDRQEVMNALAAKMIQHVDEKQSVGGHTVYFKGAINGILSRSANLAVNAPGKREGKAWILLLHDGYINNNVTIPDPYM